LFCLEGNPVIASLYFVAWRPQLHFIIRRQLCQTQPYLL